MSGYNNAVSGYSPQILYLQTLNSYNALCFCSNHFFWIGRVKEACTPLGITASESARIPCCSTSWQRAEIIAEVKAMHVRTNRVSQWIQQPLISRPLLRRIPRFLIASIFANNRGSVKSHDKITLTATHRYPAVLWIRLCFTVPFCGRLKLGPNGLCQQPRIAAARPQFRVHADQFHLPGAVGMVQAVALFHRLIVPDHVREHRTLNDYGGGTWRKLLALGMEQRRVLLIQLPHVAGRLEYPLHGSILAATREGKQEE